MTLAIQAIGSTLFGLLFFGIGLFLPAWTFDYWQAWVFIAVFTVATMIPSLYLAVTNPAALRRRLNAGPTAETRPVQRIIISATVLLVVAVLVVSALGHRFGWSSVPLSVVWVGNVLVAVGLVVVLLAVPVLAARILDEEKLLTEQLDGYRDYITRVRSRLIPYVW